MRVCKLFYTDTHNRNDSAKLIDEDEWIDVGSSSKKKKRRKSGRKSSTKTTKDLEPMPPLHEVRGFAAGEIRASASSAFSPHPLSQETDFVDAADTNGLGTRTATRCTSDLNDGTSTRSTPEVKLTFAKGQFMDTEDDLLAKATLGDSDGYVIRGVKASFQPGHCAILPRGGM